MDRRLQRRSRHIEDGLPLAELLRGDKASDKVSFSGAHAEGGEGAAMQTAGDPDTLPDDERLGPEAQMPNLDSDSSMLKSQSLYSARLASLRSLLREQGWDDVSWTANDDGTSLWVTLPERLKASTLLRAAEGEGVTFDIVDPADGGEERRDRIRLSVIKLRDEETLHTGAARFCAAMNAFLARSE